MATCNDCKFYEPIDEAKGNSFGHEVRGDRDANECPAKAFQPK